MSNTLEKLIDLRNFIVKNPTKASAKWHKFTSCDKPAILLLKKHNIVVNRASNRKPKWEWTGVIPNYKTAQRVDELRKVHYADKKERWGNTPEIKTAKLEFADVLYGMKIDLNDNITFQVQRDSARIYRKDNGVAADFDNINVFNKVLSLLK
jgi:hypothetical protein